MKQTNSKKLDATFAQKLKNKTILVTGGAGSIGSYLVEELLKYPISSLRVLDIDEHALFQLNRKLKNKKLRLLLGSIIDKERVEMACNNVDIIIHTAAIKNIEISEFNPIETINTNINGTVNLIQEVTKQKPQIFLNISTDKAADASTLYGTTKQLGEKLTSWAGGHIQNTKFASLRFGNVIETRGNVFEVWKEELHNNIPLSLTDPSMKRYFFHIDEAVQFMIKCLFLANRGEIFVPQMKLYAIKDMAKKYSSNHKIIGLRKGEKMEEILITNNELKNAKKLKDMWVITPK